MSDHLIDHRYTVLEIERMRVAVKGTMRSWVWHNRYTSSSEHCEPADIEDQLRTYMLAGIRPEELETIQNERFEEYQRSRPPADELAEKAKNGGAA